MGIRITKVLGYALTDVEIKNNQLADERINFDQTKDDRSLDSFLKFCNSQDDIIDFERQIFKGCLITGNIDDCVTFNLEDSENNILMFTPHTSFNTWIRHDDIIDYMEAVNNGEMCNQYINLPFGIFPWISSFQDINGLRFTNDNIPKAKIVHEIIRNYYSKERNIRQLNILISHLERYKTIDEAISNIFPIIPKEVIYLCKFLNIFKEESTIYQLRPILYTYWS